MPDIADRANDLVEMIDEMALKKVRSKLRKAEFLGYCLTCEAEVKEPRRWCDADCRDLWEKERR